jgi:MoxR-like ATPase
MSNLPDPNNFPWEEINNLEKFRSPEWTDRILHGLSVYEPYSTRVDHDRRNTVVELLHKHSQTVVNRLNSEEKQGLEQQLKKMFVGKDEIIKMVIVCAIAQQPMLLVGSPGTAKSKIITRFCEGLGVGRIGQENTKNTWFQYLLHGFTEPDEILGPVDLALLRDEKRFVRYRQGSITESEVIFLDEVFKANSAILNALLTIINERRVYEGGSTHRAKARIIYGVSNAPPTPRQLEELRAFYERFIIRMESSFIPLSFSQGGPSQERVRLLKEGWKGEVGELRAGYDPAESALSPVACLNDILFCNRAVTELWGGENLEDTEIQGILNHYHNLVTALGGGDAPACTIDDRKFIRLFLVVRAHALYTHNGAPTIGDLCILRHIWDDLSGKERVAEVVNNFIQRRR